MLVLHTADLSGVLAVILSAAKDLCVRRARPFPFAEFTLERSEGLRAAAHALKVTGIISKCLPNLRLSIL